MPSSLGGSSGSSGSTSSPEEGLLPFDIVNSSNALPSDSITTIPPRSFRQPFLESYFPPATLSASGPSTASNSAARRNGRSSTSSKHHRRSQSSHPIGASPSSRIPADEENLQTAVVLHNRDLEIYVTLPSAEKRLFVDVQEEIYLPDSTSSGPQKTKKQKVDHHSNVEEKSATGSTPTTSSNSSATINSSASSMQVDKVTASSKGTEKAAKPTSTPLAPKDPSSTSSAGTSSKSVITSGSVPTITISDQQQKKKNATTSTSFQEGVKKQESQPRIPYSTFEHVKLNVRVKPSSHKAKGKNQDSSGVKVAALSKPAVQPKVIDRFPIRILGSTTRPTAIAGLQDTFDLSVQGCTDIASLLVLLYTRIKPSHTASFPSLELNAIRLWHLDEDKLTRLSSGNIASNCITPKSILVYTVAKPLGKSFVNVYADEEKVDRVEVEVQLARTWQRKEEVEGLEESKPANAPRRQLFKFKHDLRKTSPLDEDDDEDDSDSRNKRPYNTSFTIPLLAELNEATTPLDAALDQARKEHEERTVEKRKIREEREAERQKEIARLEVHRKRLQKNKNKNRPEAGNESLANDGFVAVHTVEGTSPATGTDPSAVHAEPTGISHAENGGESDDESDWDSDDFVDEWYNSHEPLDDECDDDLSFQPYRASVGMAESVLLASAARPTLPSASASSSSSSTGRQAPPIDATSSAVPDRRPGIPSVQDGVEHILTSLGLPKSANEAFIKEFVKAAAVYPYVAVKLINEEDTACAVDLEAKYQPLHEEGTFWDIKDIQQVFLVYKGVWKSEVEDWKKGCKNVYATDWPGVALGAVLKETMGRPAQAVAVAPGAPQIAAVPPAIAAPATAIPPAVTATSASSATTSATTLTAEKRFTAYRTRTSHRRRRTCTACGSSDCTHSRHIDAECDCGECEGDDDGEDDEFFKYYDQAQATSSTTTASSPTSRAEDREVKKETIASVMVPGHRARVVQCIYLEAF